MKGILRTKYRHFPELWNTFFKNCEPIANYHMENIILATSYTELAFLSSTDAK